ncbi:MULTISPECIES: hypothetical protein [Methylobacterium]|uniref:hypothetical protein n=1 Tax=Methylobacterium TaxID=407 RepID=UPI001F1A1967|nr:hypothetical protein [Methylobacterium oryzae]UIN34832.1 hypothetical protein LXM90_27875 [Methylobacterium oryzae]
MNVSKIRDAMRYCDLPDALDYSITELRLGLPSSRDGRTSAAPVQAIWEIKTGNAQ